MPLFKFVEIEFSGLFTRIKNKIATITVLQYINFINNKLIGKIKHTLI